MHYNDVIMAAMVSHITGVSTVCSTVCSGADKENHENSASLAFVRGIYRWPVDSPHKGSVTENISIWWRHQGSLLCYDGLWIIFNSSKLALSHRNQGCLITTEHHNIGMTTCSAIFGGYFLENIVGFLSVVSPADWLNHFFHSNLRLLYNHVMW